MNKKIQKIEIVMENCEVFSIPIEHINIMCKGISRTICTFNGDGTVLDELVADEVVIFIDNASMEIRNEFSSLAERIKTPDITHIDLIYDDGTNDYISVPWEGEDDYINKAQKLETFDNKIQISIRKR